MLLSPYELRVEWTDDPQSLLNIDTKTPSLSWKLLPATTPTGITGNLMQTSYQIQAASCAADNCFTSSLLWDTGKVISNRTLGIVYGGNPLSSEQVVFWRVRVSGNSSDLSGWSSGSFRVGRLDQVRYSLVGGWGYERVVR